MKIGKVQLAEAIKKSIIENGGGEERANLISESVINQLDEIGYHGATLTREVHYNTKKPFDNDISIDKHRGNINESKITENKVIIKNGEIKTIFTEETKQRGLSVKEGFNLIRDGIIKMDNFLKNGNNT